MVTFQRNGADFLPFGANYIDEHPAGVVLTFNVGHYDSAQFAAKMAGIAAYSYNTVRLFAWPDNGGNATGAGIDPAYWANVADGIKQAYAHGLVTILSCAGLPVNGGYRPSFPASGYSYNAAWFYLTAQALTARNQYVADFCTALRAHGVTAAMLLALELTGEIGYVLTDYPLNQTGAVTTKTGTYTLPAQRAAMMNDGIRGYLNGNVGGTYTGQIAATKAAFPGVPVMVQLSPTNYGQDLATYSYPNAEVLTHGTQDAVGLSMYPTYDVSVPAAVASLGVGPVLPGTYIYTALETGWLVTHSGTLNDMANRSIAWTADCYAAGIHGFSFFLWDTPPVDSSGYWPMTSGNYTFANLLSPTRIGDGSAQPTPVLPPNAPVILPLVSHDLYLLDKDGNPANFINGRPVYGALAGWQGLSYTPVGGAIDTVPQNTVRIPLSDWRNSAVDVGAQILIRDTAVSDDATHGEVTRGPVLDVAQTIDDAGVHWATVTFADALYELSRADVTSGFATSQGETLSATVTRLLSLSDTAWSGSVDIAGLDGVAFQASGSVAQAFDKLRQERFGHFRREQAVTNYGTTIDPRRIHLSAFGTPWTINGQPVWFVPPAEDPTWAAANPNQRQMFAPTITRRGEIVNSYTPTGGGTGISQLTLRTLYGTAFAGLDPRYLIYRRIQQAGSTSDGYDYYVEDPVSIATYGRTRQMLSKPGIAAVVNSAGGVSAVDEQSAAIALYITTIAQLKLTATPVTELAFTTPGIGDIRNCGGMTAHVRYLGYAFDPSRQVYQFLDLDDDYTILSVVRAVDDATGAATDTFTVSSTGQAAATTGGTLLGVMDTVTAMHAGVQTYPFGRWIPKSQNIGAGADLVVDIPADNSVVRRHWAFLHLTLEGMVHTRQDPGHVQDVVTQPTNHDVSALPHDLAAQANWHFKVGGVETLTGSVVYDPSAKFHLASTSPPASAQPVVSDGQYFWLADGSHAGRDIPLSALVLSIFQANPTTGAQAPGSGPIGGTVAATTGGKAGTTVKQTHATSGGFGALKATATVEDVYRGPAPTGVTVWVDGVQRYGPFNSSPAALDILPWIGNGQVAHTVTIKTPTNGMASVMIDVRDDISTFAVTASG